MSSSLLPEPPNACKTSTWHIAHGMPICIIRMTILDYLILLALLSNCEGEDAPQIKLLATIFITAGHALSCLCEKDSRLYVNML